MSDDLRPEVSYFNEKSAAYRAEYDAVNPEGYSFRVRRDKVLALVPDGVSVVDIASGPGVMVRGLREKGCTVTCVDAAPEMIARAKEEHGADARAVVGDAYALPFKDGEFEVALAMGLIEYLDHEDTFLKEAFRILRPGGMLIITFPNYVSPWRAFNRLFLSIISLVRALFGKKKKGPVTHREYTVRQASRLLAANGFSAEAARHYNFKLVPYPLDRWFPRFTVAQSRLFEVLDATPLKFFGTGFIIKARKP